MRWIENIGRFVFGSECLACGRASDYLDPWLCPHCVKELESLSKELLFPGADVYSLFPMRPITQKLIHTLKYKGIYGMATYLVQHSSAKKSGLMGGEFGLLPKPLYWVPVPLHRARLRERGYNQAEKIASALAVAAGGRVCKWLRRKSFVVSQTKLSKEERERNVANAFECQVPKEIPNRGTIMIVDDVYTTGATTGACIEAFEREIRRGNFSGTGPLLKVCTLLYDEPVSAVADYAADCQTEWY